MIAPKVSRRFFNLLYMANVWFLFVRFWKFYERVVPPSKHITLDGIDGGERRPYLTRWHVLPRNKWFNIYLHRFLHGDDDRALHDHPWRSASLILEGRYTEHTAEYYPVLGDTAIDTPEFVEQRVLGMQKLFTPGDGRRYVEGSVSRNQGQYPGHDRFDYTQHFGAGDFRVLEKEHRHLIALYGNNDEPCLTLFMTGRLLRRWGFWCKNGWRDFAEYTAPHPTMPNAT
jgi:hypothetical protein